MVVAYKSGLVEKYTDLARLLWSRRVASALECGVVVGGAVWLGGGDGSIRVLDGGTGAVGAEWTGHLFRVRSMAVVGTVVFSLAADGAVRGWPCVQPPPPAAVTAWKVRLGWGGGGV